MEEGRYVCPFCIQKDDIDYCLGKKGMKCNIDICNKYVEYKNRRIDMASLRYILKEMEDNGMIDRSERAELLVKIEAIYNFASKNIMESIENMKDDFEKIDGLGPAVLDDIDYIISDNFSTLLSSLAVSADIIQDELEEIADKEEEERVSNMDDLEYEEYNRRYEDD